MPSPMVHSPLRAATAPSNNRDPVRVIDDSACYVFGGGASGTEPVDDTAVYHYDLGRRSHLLSPKLAD